MVPVVPFAVMFMAIVEAQRPECHALSHAVWVCADEPPKPPELSMVVIPTPTPEEFKNYDVWRLSKACHFPPRLPPYTTRFATAETTADCMKPTLTPLASDYKDDDELLRVQRCLPGRRDICPIDELRPVYHGPAASDEASNVLMP
jgi:hypothetical protein